MSSIAYIEEEKRDLAKDIYKLARLWILFMDFVEGVIVVINGVESLVVSPVKEKQDQTLIWLDLKASSHKQRVLAIEKGEDGMLKYQGRLCYSNRGY